MMDLTAALNRKNLNLSLLKSSSGLTIVPVDTDLDSRLCMVSSKASCTKEDCRLSVASDLNSDEGYVERSVWVAITLELNR